MRVYEYISAYGHKKILATHKSTFEITKDEKLSYKGNCIIAVRADKSIFDLSKDFKELAKSNEALIKVELEADELKETVYGRGSENLSFLHPKDLVFRKSNYICDRTLMILANKAALDLSREFIEKLKNPNQKIKVTLIVEV
ncbi:DUF371 domain-containing protein [Candidatus Bathyarchaeota archaeon]|nr:DUF371 domain-containing protein [Candidatus Bathyarchaeota archaeon]